MAYFSHGYLCRSATNSFLRRRKFEICAATSALKRFGMEVNMDSVRFLLNDNWKFHLGEAEDAWFKGYDDSSWESVTEREYSPVSQVVRSFSSTFSPPWRKVTKKLFTCALSKGNVKEKTGVVPCMMVSFIWNFLSMRIHSCFWAQKQYTTAGRQKTGTPARIFVRTFFSRKDGKKNRLHFICVFRWQNIDKMF